MFGILLLLLVSVQSADADRASVVRFAREWTEATAKRGPEGYASYFAADAMLLPPDAAPILGRDNIKAWMASQADLPYRAQPEFVNQDEIRIMGDVALVRTTLRGKRVMKDGSGAASFENKYLDVLRRKTDGGWEFVSRMWSSNLAR